MSERPRLVITTTDMPPAWGGIQRLVGELGTRLSATWDVTVIAPADPAAAEHDSRQPHAVVRLSASWEQSKARVLAEMARAVRRASGDVLLGAHVNVLPALLAARAPRALILHGSELWAPRTAAVARTLGRTVSAAMAVSSFTAEQAAAAGIPADRVVVTPLGASPLPPGDDAAELARLGLSGRPYVLTVSRLDEAHKGQDSVIRALPSLAERHPDLAYVVAGSGPRLSVLKSLATELGVANRVVTPGAIDEATKGALMRQTKAFVMVSKESRRPALFEGFGIAYLEAAFAGRPSIAGRAGGVADAVVDGETGLLVDTDSPAQLHEAIDRLLAHPDEADALGARAQRRAEANFTWEHAVARFGRVLEGLRR